MGMGDLMDVNFEHYKVFYYCAKYGSLTEAAQKLFVSQPAVTVAIKKFEQSLGFKVFDRSRSGVTLTPAGIALYEKVAPACQLIFSAEEEIYEVTAGFETHPEVEEVIRTAASELSTSLWLIPKLKSFQKAYPNVRLDVDFLPSFSANAGFSSDRYDFAILNTPFETNPDYEVVDVGTVQDVFVCGKEYEWLTNRVLTFEELAQFPLVMPSSDTSIYVYLEGLFRSHGVVLRPAYQFGSLSVMRDAISRGLGIGISSYTTSMSLIEGHSLFRLKTREALPSRKICIVTSKHHPLGIAADSFMHMALDDDPATHDDANPL